jgi:ribosome-binding factor A
MKGERMRRVNEILREAIAEEVRDLKDPRIGFVTITGVDTSPDLRTAIVYYSVLEEDHAPTGEALQHAAPHIQEGIASQVRLKYLPKLRFELDASIAYGARIDAILADIHKEDDEHPASS